MSLNNRNHFRPVPYNCSRPVGYTYSTPDGYNNSRTVGYNATMSDGYNVNKVNQEIVLPQKQVNIKTGLIKILRCATLRKYVDSAQLFIFYGLQNVVCLVERKLNFLRKLKN